VLASEANSVRAAVAKYWPTMDVADGCVLQLAERFPQAKVITTDLRDFRIYCRHRTERLSFIHP
jgi:hypothetical protein